MFRLSPRLPVYTVSSLPPVSPFPPVSPLPPARQGTSPVAQDCLGRAGALFLWGAARDFWHVLCASPRKPQGSRVFQAGARTTGIISSPTAESGMRECDRLRDSWARSLPLPQQEKMLAAPSEYPSWRRKQPLTGCEYLAKGTPAEMTAKHIAAMMAARTAPALEQQQDDSRTSPVVCSAARARRTEVTRTPK